MAFVLALVLVVEMPDVMLAKPARVALAIALVVADIIVLPALV